MAGRLKEKAPGLHRFLTRQDKPFPLVREVLVGVLLIVALLGVLFTATGQPFPGGSPIVVVTSGSMMHCTNLDDPQRSLGSHCDPTSLGRLGTIDPGDLVFVRHVGAAVEVATKAQGLGSHYGGAGDVIVYQPNGDPARTPIIHRALFWLTVEPDGTFSVPDLGVDHAPRLDQPAVTQMAGCLLSAQRLGPADSGFVTRGDNNPSADACPGLFQLSKPVHLDWIRGEARGEVPWVGLVKLWVDQVRGASPQPFFSEAPTDSKVALLLTVALLVGGPYAVRAVRRRRARIQARSDAPASAPDAPGPEPPRGPAP